MNKLFKFLPALVLVCSIIGLNSSCKKKFDNPPYPSNPLIVANTTIAQLKAMHTVAAAYDVITDDIIISGVVTANDKSGNFYKTIFVQDATGALQVNLDATGLYGTYPVGRRLFIRCKDLCLTDYNGTMFIGKKVIVSGAPTVDGIPGNLINNHVIGGSLNNPVTPIVVTQGQLGTNMQDPYIGALIQLNDYEFQLSDLTKTYGDTSYYKNSVNLIVKNCSGPSIIVRSSGYANFAGASPAKGNGNITSIYTVFGSTKQLVIRDTADVKFYGPRCFLFEEDFGSIGANSATYASTTGWKNIGEVGGKLYQNAVFGSVKCVKISAFSTGQATVNSWLISPAIAIPAGTTPKLSFTTAVGFASSLVPGFKAYISTDYDGGNTPSTSTATTNNWTVLSSAFIQPPVGASFTSFASSGNVDLSAYAGKTIYIGFKYEGSDPTKTATYELDDVRISKN